MGLPRIYTYTSDDGTVFWSFQLIPGKITPPTRLTLQSRLGVHLVNFIGFLRRKGQVISEGKTASEDPSVYIYIPVDKKIAQEWSPDGRKGEDDSAPHLTVLYLGPTPKARIPEVRKIVREVCADQKPFEIKFSKGVKWFTAEKGKEIAHKGVVPETHEILEDLHERLWSALSDFSIKHVDKDFKSHATLAYSPTRDYDGPSPEGSWTATGLQVGVEDDGFVDIPFAAVR